MKKVILSFALVTGAAVAANAQSASFGIKAGASLTNFTGKGTDGVDTKNKFGFNGGFVANFGVNDVFSIQPELLYSMKGTKVTERSLGSGPDATITSTLHYIDVPVLAHINAGGLFFELGPQIGFLVAAKQKSEYNGQSDTQDVKSSIKTVDFGYAAGLGYQMPAGPGVGLRYNGGFTNIDKDNNSNSALHNSAFQLYLTYMFGGK
ncbi:porin family protein [Hymenobacter caeli]|uniref:Outer membrane protein beta-barrel domain-containing protein n=1 Tax=Hymenobacter caeli TaxID=2735894 RepID=A0ABX2FVQ9_9BACT|nr:porin family protein [Hymenobacter caeli]NRT21298.1 hypothetical protein [Hymenobacter caeli]